MTKEMKSISNSHAELVSASRNKEFNIPGFRLGGRNDDRDVSRDSSRSFRMTWGGMFRMTDKNLRHVEAHRAETSHDTTTSLSFSGLTRESSNKDSESGRALFFRHVERSETSHDGSESGRSMVEMLGTLAIMGVLSVGAVAGYRYAMDKLNANTILNGISKRAVTASQQRLLGRGIDLTEFERTIQTYPVGQDDNYDGDTGFFVLSVDSVPKGICDKVVQDKPRLANDILVNNTFLDDGDNCPDGNSKIEFLFANNLDPDAELGEVEPTCPPNSYAENGECVCSLTHTMVNGECVSCGYLGICATCTVVDGTVRVTPLPSGTACVISGVDGMCDAYGQCQPNEGEACSSQGSCPTGEFCNYGGTNTSNTCQKVNALTKEIEGVTYYYPPTSDIKSWCRPSSGDTNCVWGYLSGEAAQDWCRQIGKQLISKNNLTQTKEVWREKFGNTPSCIWYINGGIGHYRLAGDSWHDNERTDGYWGGFSVKMWGRSSIQDYAVMV